MIDIRNFNVIIYFDVYLLLLQTKILILIRDYDYIFVINYSTFLLLTSLLDELT